jgi:hypothetical protein
VQSQVAAETDYRIFESDVFAFTPEQLKAAKGLDACYETLECTEHTFIELLRATVGDLDKCVKLCQKTIKEDCEVFLGFNPESANYDQLKSDLNAVCSTFAMQSGCSV